MSKKRLRVCYFGTYRATYSRNEIMMEGLRRNGIDVMECHAQLWHGFEDRVHIASGAWMHPQFWWRVLRTYGRVLYRYWRLAGKYDVLVVGYPGQVDVFLARILSKLHGKPLAWDIFMSIYLIAMERKLDERSKATVMLIRWLEKTACSMADMLILDTSDYVAWFYATHQVAPERFRLVPTGADERIFTPVNAKNTAIPHEKTPFRVVYYGTFIPNHGVEYIIEAARLLEHHTAIHFELIGGGPEKEKAEQLTQHYALSNVTFTSWLSKDALVERVAQADVCLGAFGTTPQSMMTVQNKIYEALAMQKPIITGDSSAVREVLEHGTYIYLCERANPQSLVDAILRLYGDARLCKHMSEDGYRKFVDTFDITHIGQLFAQHLYHLVGWGSDENDVADDCR